MLNQEKIHRYFNHLSGAKRIEFLYGLLHLCQPLELRYLGTCLEEIARKDYEYLYHAEQKTNHIGSQTVPSTSSTANDQDENNSSIDMLTDEKLDLTDQLARAYAIVDIGLKLNFCSKMKSLMISFFFCSSSMGKKSNVCPSIVQSSDS